ncbi:hypothetical protein CcaCcLH18_05926 [Colletotrichum camelliae]|nr:hypothetical protein CcaCcLH18_05926 [Colletotrichum camelliae]
MASQSIKETQNHGNEEISIVCEEQVVGDCCNGAVNTLYSSAQASDDQGGVVLYGLDQGQAPDSENRCGLQLAKHDTCARTDIPQGSAAGDFGEEGGDEDPSTDEEPTDGDEDGEDDGGDLDPEEQERQAVARLAPNSAHGDVTHVWKLSRDSEHAPAYEALTDRQERVDFLKRHGVAKRR